MSLKTESQKQHWVTPSLLFPKVQACSPPTSRDVLLQRAVRRGAGWMLSPFLMILAYDFFVAAFCMVLFSCGTMSVQVLHHALQKKGMEREGVVKIWCLNWFGSLLPGLRSECSHEQPGWLHVMSSCGTFRAALQLQKDVSGVPCWAELGCLLTGCLPVNIGLEENGKKPSCYWKQKLLATEVWMFQGLLFPCSEYLQTGLQGHGGKVALSSLCTWHGNRYGLEMGQGEGAGWVAPQLPGRQAWLRHPTRGCFLLRTTVLVPIPMLFRGYPSCPQPP